MKTLNIILVLFFSVAMFPQSKGVFVGHQSGYYDDIMKGINEFNKKETPEDKTFKVDLTGLDLPKSTTEFQQQWHNPPISQGNTGTCWCFSTTSFFESEVNRITGKKVKLSEMYTVYCEYLEKAERYIDERGNSEFSEGSEANAVTRLYKKYGVMPAEAYSGMKPGQKFHDHSKLVDEMTTYLKSLKANNGWDKEEALNTIKSILNHYLGVPPVDFTVDGKKFTPKEYLSYIKINPDDYVDIMSLEEQPYFKQVEYKVSDNWWHNADYYNVPLDLYMSGIKNAIKNGYTMCIGGDVSEAGYDTRHDVAIVPSFDIPSQNINEDARQFRFSNGTTTDDHGIHLIGYKNQNGKTWFLIKDSGAGSRNGNNKGYIFYDEDYVKLKIMDFMVHKDAVKDLLSKFN